MEIEQLEIYDFLKKCHPLNKLTHQQMIQLVQSIEIAYFRRGQVIFTPNTENNFLYLIRTGAVERTDNTKGLVARFSNNDFFGYRALERNGIIKKKVKAIEDTLAYLIPGDIYFKLLGANKDFRRYFHQQKNKRLRSALQEIHTQANNNLQNKAVRDLIKSSVLTLKPETSIFEAAKKMTDSKKTAAIIMGDKEILGIVTDRVFCSKVVARSLNAQDKITTIMSENLITLTPDNSGIEALLLMARHNIRHLPIVENGILCGLLTATDLIHHQSHNPIYLINEIHKCNKTSQLSQLAKSLPDTLCKLVESGNKSCDIEYSISSAGRAICQRLIELAIEKFGTPPIDFAFLVAGSLARNEQTVHSDQDNCIILSDNYNEHRHGEYFSTLTRFISDGLNECGYVYCPGNVMATNKKWCQPYSKWKSYFNSWVNTPQPKALMLSSIFFDMRCIYGNRNLLDSLHDEIQTMIQKNKIFISFMTANALQNTPPLGIFRRFVLEKHGEEEKSLDMKKRGIMPCIDMARIFALDAGIQPINTRERIKESFKHEVITKVARDDLLDAFDFVCTIRLKHQAENIKLGKEANNYVNPEELSSLERRHLKDAFELIRTYQEVLSNKYRQGHA